MRGCIEQMHRLYCECLYRADGRIPVDEKRLVRIDDRELRPDIQEKVGGNREGDDSGQFPSTGRL